MEEFFWQVHGDLTKVTWAHSVNSIQRFNQAVKDGLMMFEADVLLGYLEGSPLDNKIPIMCHPPEDQSDLSLECFLNKACRLKNIGVKLDFKTQEVVEPSFLILKAKESCLNFPVWLNADILRGPFSGSEMPINADYFLTKCKELFPQNTLSLGWKVTFGDEIPEGQYEDCHVISMKAALVRNDIAQPVTFAVEAGLASRSLDTLPELLNIPDIATSLTLWGGKNGIDFSRLRDLIFMVGKNRTYIDLPHDLIKKLNLS